MDYKYKLGEPVVYTKDTQDDPHVVFLIPPICIVYDYEHFKYFNKYDKKIFLRKGIIYVISKVETGCYLEDGELGGQLTAKEKQLSPYTGNDEEELEIFRSAKKQWLQLYENDDL